MTSQATLPFAPQDPTLRDLAEDWIEANPEAMALFRRFADEMRCRGKRFGIGQLTERVRWECAVTTRGDTFKINNNYRAYIARRLIEDDPRLEGLIETRKVAQ